MDIAILLMLGAHDATTDRRCAALLGGWVAYRATRASIRMSLPTPARRIDPE